MENVTKDIGEIYTRLLDHKAITQGETRYFIKEFENKRNDRENKRLHADLEKLKDINSTAAPQCMAMLQTHLPHLLDQLEAANKIAKNLHSKEEKRMEVERPGAGRRRRDESWGRFLEELSRERDKEDVAHAREISRMDDHYARLADTLSGATK